MMKFEFYPTHPQKKKKKNKNKNSSLQPVCVNKDKNSWKNKIRLKM